MVRGHWQNGQMCQANLHHQDLLWCVIGLQLRYRHLLNKAEVIDELPFPLSQLVDNLC